MSMEMQNRNTVRFAGIELFRVVLMFGICLLHSIDASEFSGGWMSYMLRPCVVGFVFISGWFGIKFRPSKLIRLYCTGIFCCIVSVAVTVAVFGDNSQLEDGFFRGILWMWTKSLWFLHAYAVMMLLAPLMNLAVETLQRGDKRMWSVLLPVLFLVFGWAFAVSTPLVRKVIPCTSGVLDYSGVTLAGIYIGGRLFRILGMERLAYRKCTIFLFLALLILVGPLRLGNYASPFAFALSAILFCWFKDVHLPKRIGAFFLWIAPSMFSIYLLHGHKYGKVWLRELNSGEWSYVCGVAGTAIIVFVSCLLMDLMRRVVYSLVKHRVEKVLERIDTEYDRRVNGIGEMGASK